MPTSRTLIPAVLESRRGKAMRFSRSSRGAKSWSNCPRQVGKPVQLGAKLALLGRKEELPLPELIVERRAKGRGQTTDQLRGGGWIVRHGIPAGPCSPPISA